MKKKSGKALRNENRALKGRTSKLQQQPEKITVENEKAQAAEYARIKTVIGNLDAGIFLLSLGGHIIFADNQIASILGCAHSEIIGKEYLAFVFPEEQEKAKKDLSNLLSADVEALKIVRKLIRGDGQPFWGQILGKLVKSSAGNPEFLVFMVTDISLNKKIENDLQETESRFKAIFNTAQVGMFRSRISSGLLLDANDKLAQMFLFSSKEELIQSGSFTRDFYVDPAQRERIVATAIANGGIINNVEIELWRRNKTKIWVLCSGTYSFDKDLIDGVLIDITDRKNAEKAIREKEKRLSGIFRAVPVGLGIVFQRHFTEVNEQICQMSGYSREELLGHSTEMLYLSRDDYEKIGSLLYSMLAKNGTASIEAQWRHKSGRPVDILLNLAPLDPGNPDSGIAVSILDLTQRKRSESERERLENLLRQAQKMEVIGRFAGGIAHDFGNLLSPIAGYASLLSFDIPEPDPKHVLIKQIINTATKAKMLIQQLLMFSRQQPVEKSAIDLKQMINNLLAMLQPAIPENICVSCQFDLPLSPIIGDTMQVEQVFLNLIVNAKDAMPSGGTITIGLEETLISEPLPQFTPIPLEPGQYILLTVKDSGTGIPTEILPKIFEPFFSTKKAGKGTGLGLSIVYEIVEKHCGSIQVQSEIGRGTTFKVYFPVFGNADKTEILRHKEPGA